MRSPLPEDQGPTLSPMTHMCRRHLEPFRRGWPEGIALMLMALTQEAIGRTEISDAAGEDPRMLDRVLREFAPLCCFVGDEVTARWTRLSLGPAEAFEAAHEALLASQHAEPESG